MVVITTGPTFLSAGQQVRVRPGDQPAVAACVVWTQEIAVNVLRVGLVYDEAS